MIDGTFAGNEQTQSKLSLLICSALHSIDLSTGLDVVHSVTMHFLRGISICESSLIGDIFSIILQPLTQ